MYITPLFFPNLLKIQRNSFLNFLEYGIKKEIIKFDGVINKKKNVYVTFYPRLYQLNIPNNNCNECILNSKTYGCEVVIPVKMNFKQIKTTWIIINNIPIMTNKCHFITNGSPRVIMSQITRSPGIYYHKGEQQTKIKNNKELNTIYYADVIAERGNWLRLEIDSNDIIWMKIKKTPKIPALIFLQAIGIKNTTILEYLKFPILKQYNNMSFFTSQKEAITKIELLSQMDNSKLIKNTSSMNWNRNKITLFDRLLNNKYYDLGKIGRIQINKKFGNYSTNDTFVLNSFDLLSSIDFLLKVKHKIEDVDDIDNLKNKRVRVAGELVQSQFSIGVLRLQRSVKEKISNTKKNWTIENLFSSGPINSTIAEFFGINPLSQFMDEINPLATITHKRRLSSLGIGGVSRDTATMTIRSIHPTLYGRICPIETPEGKNAGLVNSFALFANLNHQGLIETPVFKLFNGQIMYDMGVNYIATDYETKTSIVPYDVKKSRIGFLPKQKLPARIRQQLKELDYDKIDFISVSRIQMLSIATSLIPFLEHNDANRVLMGSNMQRQAVPLIKPECSLVGTGLESKILYDLHEGLKSYSSGIINKLSSEKITIYNIIKRSRVLKNFNPTKLHTKNFIKTRVTNFLSIPFKFNKALLKNKTQLQTTKYLSTLKFQKINYFLKEYKGSNQGTCAVNRIKVNERQWITKSSFLSNGFSSNRNELALGNNLFVGYISWKGYNFEDAVVMSENLVLNHAYTSTHIEKFETEIKRNKENSEILTKNINGATYFQKKNLNDSGIIKIGARVYSGDILVGKMLPIEITSLSPYRKLLYEILKKQTDSYKDTSLRVPRYKRGRITFVDSIYNNLNAFNVVNNNELQSIKIHLMQNRIIQIGDKISGRHGNKGVISNILPKYDMPYLKDGTPLDIVLNPLGVPSRMNIGQVLESLLGLASFYSKKRFKIIPFDEAFGFEISRNLVYSKLYFVNKRTGNNWLFNLNHPGKNRLIDAYTGLPFNQPITVGKAYILKLIHLVEEKVHARSTGSYSLVTQQPLKGKSKKGGQRVGEMEVWALEGYGAAYTLHEILTIKSDDIKSRQKVISSILNSDSIKFGATETFKVLIRELQSLCLNLQFFK